MLKLALLVATAVLALAPAARAACAFAAPPTVVMTEGDPNVAGSKLLQSWEVADDPLLWSMEEPPGYEAFRAAASRAVGDLDPLKLLAQAPSINNRLVAENAAAWIGPATCLEKLLQAHQHARIDTFVRPTEFAAMILRSGDGARLRVDYYTVNQDGIGAMTPLTDRAAAARAQGWRVAAVLHNHAFHPGQPLLNGPVAPSGPDAQFAANAAAAFGLEASWITNGIDTVRIPALAFGRFEQPQ